MTTAPAPRREIPDATVARLPVYLRILRNLLTDGVEQVELTTPWEAVQQAGGTPVLVSPKDDSITAMQGDWDHGDSFDVDVQVGSANAADYAGLVLPGGTVNSDTLRGDADAQAFVTAFEQAGTPIAAICHAPWILIETGIAKGRRLTSYTSLRTDLKNAGADVVDEQVVTDRGLTTSRNPDDLDAFCATIVEQFAG